MKLEQNDCSKACGNPDLTYKKAIKVICDHLNDHGFSVTRSAQKQVGYLALYATEGEISKQLHHEIKSRLKNLPCNFEAGSMEDEKFEVFMERYAKLLGKENPEGGEISLGWLFKELHDQEIWQVFSGHEI